MERNRHLAQGSGVALGDVDGDGRVDIYMARIDGPNALYRNLGGWRFEEIAPEAGVDAPGSFSTGATFADVDGDGDVDLLVTALGGPNSLFMNDGSGSFSDVTEAAGLTSDLGSMTITMADVEGDGDLDLYVSNYKVRTVSDIYGPRELQFNRVVRQLGERRYEVVSAFRDHYRVQVREDLDIVVRSERGEPDQFYLNDGTGRFQPVSFTSGRFLDESGTPILEEPDYFTLSAKFQDIDDDGDPDLFVCADFEDPDLIWLNDGTGTFQAISPLAIRTTSNSTMAIDFADFDRDGFIDFFESDMLSRDPIRRMTQKPSHTALPKLVGRIDDRPQMMRNTLFRNRGDGTFEQISYFAGVEASDWTWGSLFLDVDLDGYEDILNTTGHVWDVMDWDTQNRVASSRNRSNWRRERFLFPQLHLENALFRNNGDLTFDEVAREWGFANEADVSHGMAIGDLDSDGDLDVVINRLGFDAGLFRNDATSSRIKVRLVGTPPNTQGVGAKISVLNGAVSEQIKEVSVGGAYLSSADPVYSFATGDAGQVTIEVRWRSGATSTVVGAIPNREYEIWESNAETAGPAETGVNESLLATPMFSDVSEIIDHVHTDSLFDDYARQPLLPNRLSQLGPGISWYDIDFDDDEDLVIGTGAGGSISILLNENGTFTRYVPQHPPSGYDLTSLLVLPAGDGSNKLIFGVSSHQALNPRASIEIASVQSLTVEADEAGTIRLANSPSVEVPGDTSSVGPLAIADYDADGDLDLFVGGRAIPGAYPVAASSRLYLNNNSNFSPDLTNTRILQGIGLVSAATFSDMDGDGDVDLLVALEWGSIKLFINQRGVFTESGAEFGLEQYLGRWNGITTGDLNNDGRMDIVVTNWGRNTKHDLSTNRPLELYYGDFDRNGSLDLVEAQYDPARGAVYPLESFMRVSMAMPRIRQRIQTFDDYAIANIEEAIGPTFDGTRRLEISTLDHMLFLNHGNSFEGVPLPREAQMAPSFYAGITDFNGDGNEDLFLSQNFFPTEVGTPRHDAGRGLLLLGDGHGTLRAIDGTESGIKVYGDQRGAAFADYDGDARVDLVVSQNGAATKLFHNEMAAPGLRVLLRGSPNNPQAIGATIRIVYEDGIGPLREVHGGSGYWSLNGTTQVMGLRHGATVTGILVRWPTGEETETPVATGVSEVTIRQ